MNNHITIDSPEKSSRKRGNCLCKVRIHSFLKTQKGLIPIISPLKSKTCIYSALSFCLRDQQIYCRTPSALYIEVKTLQRVMLYCYIANNTKIAQNKRYFNIFLKKMQDIRKKIAKSQNFAAIYRQSGNQVMRGQSVFEKSFPQSARSNLRYILPSFS